MLEKLEAVIFDYDGTIVDTETTYFEVMEFLVNKYTGKKMEKIDYIRNVSGTSVEQCKAYITSTYEVSAEKYDEMEYEMKNDMAERFYNAPLLPYIEEVFPLLKEKGVKVAVASNGVRRHIEKGLRNYNLLQYVDEIVTKYDVKNPKPAPDVYLEAAKRLGVSIKNSIAVEDSKPGATAASASGAYVILQTNDITKHFDFTGLKYDKKDCNLHEFIKEML